MFAPMIEFLIAEAGWSERTLAEKLGVSQPTVNRMRRGVQQTTSFEVGDRLRNLYVGECAARSRVPTG
jgi:transcriptional regulator with XRE-family HTH domain